MNDVGRVKARPIWLVPNAPCARKKSLGIWTVLVTGAGVAVKLTVVVVMSRRSSAGMLPIVLPLIEVPTSPCE